MRTALAVVAVAALTAPAHANPAAAEKVYRDGKDLMAKGQLDAACDAFRRSNDLEARVGTLLNLADCEEKRGKLATAWVAWVDARGLATRLGDARATLADQRAAALAPKLAYLTMKVAPNGLTSGLTVLRNGVTVPTAELGVEVPLDPGHVDVEAAAPGHIAWRQSIDLTSGQHQTIEIPILAVDPNAPVTPPTTITTTVTPPAKSPSHRLGVGAAVGMVHDGTVLYGLRVPIHLADAGPGTIRGVPSFSFSPKLDDEDPSREQSLYVIGFGLEYVHPLAPQFVLAAGVAGGLELLSDSYGNSSLSRHAWLAARVSPTLRLAHSVDLALHLQLGGGDRHSVSGSQENGGAVVALAMAGVDYFFW